MWRRRWQINVQNRNYYKVLYIITSCSLNVSLRPRLKHAFYTEMVLKTLKPDSAVDTMTPGI